MNKILRLLKFSLAPVFVGTFLAAVPLLSSCKKEVLSIPIEYLEFTFDEYAGEATLIGRKPLDTSYAYQLTIPDEIDGTKVTCIVWNLI
ncbi:MAG: hypothetical protein LBC39_08085 [Methanobrevibacter sp.]|jgi:hypothetical protein|nr:hypothetical protein [Candidatus Methanovirga aequatorialis]